MLHRLALRVIPRLHAAVTAPDVRTRKRWVMMAPGVAAFLVYRLVTQVFPLSNPLLLLAMSGTLSMLAAYWAYSMGRRETLARLARTDGLRRLLWVGGWIGGVYGVHLALLVLTLLALFVDYHFLLHPAGPSMMALIIACTAVTRDAFEIGHVVRMESHGARMTTFPDGGVWRNLSRRDMRRLALWGGAGLAAGGAVAAACRLVWIDDGQAVGPMLAVCVLGACCAHGAFVSGRYPLMPALRRLATRPWWDAWLFWTWPCLTFALTYYAVQLGVFIFVLQWTVVPLAWRLAIGGVTVSMMAGYGYALGARGYVEARAQSGVPDAVPRCPFVMEIFNAVSARASGRADALGAAAGKRPGQS